MPSKHLICEANVNGRIIGDAWDEADAVEQLNRFYQHRAEVSQQVAPVITNAAIMRVLLANEVAGLGRVCDAWIACDAEIV